MKHYTPRSRMAAGVMLLVVWVAQSGCSNNLEMIEVIIGEAVLQVEVAVTAEEQARGLMFRKEMPENHGMLFPYGSDRRLSFWMKDTLIPLSIAYIASDGTIKEIYDMKPGSLREVSSRLSVRYALEVNQGLFDRLGIGVGDTVEFPADFEFAPQRDE
jgi:uncharacterized membrane protein (UPF0127 family)